MARLSDVPAAVRSLGAGRFLRSLITRIADDDLSTQAAAVAYAWLFAVFPFLIFLITLAAYVPKESKQSAIDQITQTVQQVMQHDAAETLLTNLRTVLNQPRGGLLSVGLLVTLWVASGGMRTTMSSLDTAYDAKKRRPFWVQWPLAVLLTMIVAVMAAAVFILLPVASGFGDRIARHFQLQALTVWLFNVGRYVVAIALVLAFLSLVYQFGTVVRHPFAFVSPGAVFTLVVWFALGWGFRIYVDKIGTYQRTYGAVGGVAILLLFFYLDAWVLLVGAEINGQVDECVAATAKQLELFPPEPILGE
jgi:membrane protein